MFRDYHFHIGPSIRNRIQAITKHRRVGPLLPDGRRLGLPCANHPDCSNIGPLDAAHKIGRSRPDIIEEVLTEYLIPGTNIVECNLAEVFQKIEAAHRDFDQVFNFICRECHKKQTAEEKRLKSGVQQPVFHSELSGTGPGSFRDAAVEIYLYPADQQAFKAEVLAKKTVYVKEWLNTGQTQIKVWDASNFKETSSLMSNIRRGYARPERCKRFGIVRIDFATQQSNFPPR
jgi:hypothetical protein